MKRNGFTLLETMVALVILGLVVTASLELYGSALREAGRAHDWVLATTYAEEGMELAKVDPAEMVSRSPETLEGGFARHTRMQPAGFRLSEVTVTVVFPEGGTFEVTRLVASP